MAISFLGCVDKIGVAFEAPTISTGFGAYLAQVSSNCVVAAFNVYPLRKCIVGSELRVHVIVQMLGGGGGGQREVGTQEKWGWGWGWFFFKMPFMYSYVLEI